MWAKPSGLRTDGVEVVSPESRQGAADGHGSPPSRLTGYRSLRSCGRYDSVMRADSAGPGATDPMSPWREGFASAAAKAGRRDYWLTIAGRPARLSVAGDSLATELTKPFSHLLRSPEAVPALTIDLWDESEAGVASPTLDPTSRWQVGSGWFSAMAGNRFVGLELAALEAWLDRSGSAIVGCVTAVDQMSLHERGKPLQSLFAIWHSDRGLQLVHSGFVADNGRGALLPGPGGTGKSTCALACASAGMAYLGDDCVAIDVRGETSVGHSLYGSAYLDPVHARRLPELLPSLVRGRRPDELKALVIPNADRPVPSSAPIDAIILPRLGEGPARIQRATKREALLLLAPTSILQMVPRQDVRGFERLARLVERVPAYWLDMGPNLEEIPARIGEILRGRS